MCIRDRGRLLDWGLVEQSGRTKGVRYFVPPRLLRAAGLDRKTTLARVPPHRLRALLIEDLAQFPDSSASDIHRRVGSEIPMRTFRRALDSLVVAGVVAAIGKTRWRRYRLADAIGHEEGAGR